MEIQRKDRVYILRKAFDLGRTALVDPVPELWDESAGLAARAETMRIYFEGLVDRLRAEYEEASGEPVTPAFRNEILGAMEKGFEKLMDEQPGYRRVDKKNVTPEVRAEILEAMEMIFEAMVEERLKPQTEKTKEIWIEKEDALTFVKDVFENLKHHPVG
jgi:hypothetical protein